MLNFSNIAMTAKLFHSTNIDEWMEASAEDTAAKRQAAMSNQTAGGAKACETKIKARAKKTRRKVKS